jgi:hypothetical protein
VTVEFNTEMNFPSDFVEKVSGGRRLRRENHTNQQNTESIIDVEVKAIEEIQHEFTWELELINDRQFDIQIYFDDAI